MAQLNTVELARKGDASAIATLMNKSLRAKGVAAEAVRSGNYLEITLHSQRALNQKTMLDIVQKGMKNLQVAAIERVLVRSQLGDTPTWESEFFLGEGENALLFNDANDASETDQGEPTEPEVSPQKTTLSEPVQAIQTQPIQVSSGMVLLPKLSQVNRSLQQYQDVVIRLTDDGGCQIICLCTLAELIQSLHSPNAQLHHIAEAIAKCSSVNADGERIIRNVSILQPGQAWQKTQIRCVLQVFFEMGTGESMDFSPSEPTEPTELTAPAPEDTFIETTEAIASAEDTIIEVHRGTASRPDETVIEAVSHSKAREHGVPQPTSQRTADPLFSEFTFTMVAPVKNVTDIDTISDPATPAPPEESLSLTLEEFSRDLLAGVS